MERLNPYILIFIVILSSCSMNHHLTKAVKKGYKVERITKNIRLTDTLVINGKDSIIERTLKVDCPEPVIKTRWKTKFDYKRFNDSLDHIRQMYSDSLRNALKTSKIERKEQKQAEKTKRVTTRQENKRSLWWLWLLIGFLLRDVLKFIFKYYGLIK